MDDVTYVEKSAEEGNITQLLMATNNELQAQHFYRRQLPNTCISFCSDMGKQLFAEALATGHMNCYFKLAAQFRTQDEPAYCGLTTLVVALNALDVDPGKVWKGPWRWYHENMLSCCVPLDIIQDKGITIDEFVCIGTCNSLNVETTRINSLVTEDFFRDVIKEYSRRDDAFLALSYARAVLEQTGEGHFSPLGGYHPEKDLVLILDLARFKYPPHWVPLSLLYEAMKEIDKDTGSPRGFMELSRSGKNLLVLFRLSEHLSIRSRENQLQTVTEFIKNWHRWLQNHRSVQRVLRSSEKSSSENMTELAKECCREFVNYILQLDSEISLLTVQPDINCPKEIAKQQCCVMGRLVHELQDSLVFEEMTSVLEDLHPSQKERLEKVFPLLDQKSTCSVYNSLRIQHFAAILLLAWPEAYGDDEMPECSSCDNVTDKNLPEPETLKSEVSALREQLLVVLNFRDKFVCNSTACGKRNTCSTRQSTVLLKIDDFPKAKKPKV